MDTKKEVLYNSSAHNIFNHYVRTVQFNHSLGLDSCHWTQWRPDQCSENDATARGNKQTKTVSAGPTFLASILTYSGVYKTKCWQYLTLEVITKFSIILRCIL